MPPERLDKLLRPGTGGVLGDVVSRARDMGHLAQILTKALPGDCVDGLVAANLRDGGELVVLAASSAWAARLRYEADRILDAARAAGVDAATCRVRVSRDPGRSGPAT